MQFSITKSVRGLALWAVLLTGAVAWALAPAVADQPEKAAITENDVIFARQQWCAGLLDIGKVFREGGNYQARANQFIDDLYDYQEGRVFFKPTLAYGDRTFRPTKAGALSYFIDRTADAGFALKYWKSCTFGSNAGGSGIQIHGNIAINMVTTHLIENTRYMPKPTTVDTTFVFRKGSDGRLRLCVHHSSPHRSTK